MMVYFAYDFGLSVSDMAVICPAAKVGEAMILEGWRLAFMEQGRATIVRAPAGHVYGRIWHLSEACERSLDAALAPYHKISITIGDGTASVYVHRTGRYRLLRARAKVQIIHAAAESGFPPDYVEELGLWRTLLTPRMVNEILADYVLPVNGIHGPRHWLRVLENGLELAARTPGADAGVVELFALLHDSKRVNEDHDAAHGWRAANFVRLLAEKGLLKLEPPRMMRLIEACEFHEHGHVSSDPTIGCCWDADRLELSRLGIRPQSRYLSTDGATDLLVQKEAWKRGRGWRFIPDLARRWSITA